MRFLAKREAGRTYSTSNLIPPLAFPFFGAKHFTFLLPQISWSREHTVSDHFRLSFSYPVSSESFLVTVLF